MPIPRVFENGKKKFHQKYSKTPREKELGSLLGSWPWVYSIIIIIRVWIWHSMLQIEKSMMFVSVIP